MNDVELKSFLSINASIFWLVTTEYPVSSLYGSHLQQKIGDCRVYAIENQFIALKVLKKHGTSTRYIRPKVGTVSDVTLVPSSDTSHTKESSKLFYILGLIIGKFMKGNPVHLLSWASHISRLPA